MQINITIKTVKFYIIDMYTEIYLICDKYIFTYRLLKDKCNSKIY